MIIPNTEASQNKKEEERPFHLRVFSSEPIDLVQLPNTIEQQFKGKWAATTAGGRRVDEKGKENQFWCRNPQYFLNITKPTHLKIILKKKGGKKFKGVPIGIVVTKALSPTTPPATQIITGKAGAGNKMLSSLPTNGISYAQTLSQKMQKKERGENIPDFLPPQLMNLERKLQILNGEWFEESYFKNDDVAALYAFYQPTQGPFIIVPSFEKADYTSDFTLTSKCFFLNSHF
jgi:calpain